MLLSQKSRLTFSVLAVSIASILVSSCSSITSVLPFLESQTALTRFGSELEECLLSTKTCVFPQILEHEEFVAGLNESLRDSGSELVNISYLSGALDDVGTVVSPTDVLAYEYGGNLWKCLLDWQTRDKLVNRRHVQFAPITKDISPLSFYKLESVRVARPQARELARVRLTFSELSYSYLTPEILDIAKEALLSSASAECRRMAGASGYLIHGTVSISSLTYEFFDNDGNEIQPNDVEELFLFGRNRQDDYDAGKLFTAGPKTVFAFGVVNQDWENASNKVSLSERLDFVHWFIRRGNK